MPNPVFLKRVFTELCWTRAHLWATGVIPAEHAGDEWIGHAVDPLQAWAVTHGLVTEIGQDAVQAIMAKAFGAVR